MYTYFPKGVCSSMMMIDIDENNVIKDVKIANGCDGNLQGLTTLCKGQQAVHVIEKLRGICCGHKCTSCPDQLAQALEAALKEKKDKISHYHY